MSSVRSSRHEAVAAASRSLSDAGVSRLLASAAAQGGSMGGETAVVTVVTELVNWVVTHLTQAGRTWTHPSERNACVRACAGGHDPPELLPTAAALVRRYAPVAAVMDDFVFDLHGSSRWTPYPEEDVRAACRAAGLVPGAPSGQER